MSARGLRERLGRLVPRQRRRGRILAVKWGLNPNSSSLGVDVTFLLFGAAALSLATPVLGALIRWRRPAEEPLRDGAPAAATGHGAGDGAAREAAGSAAAARPASVD